MTGINVYRIGTFRSNRHNRCLQRRILNHGWFKLSTSHRIHKNFLLLAILLISSLAFLGCEQTQQTAATNGIRPEPIDDLTAEEIIGSVVKQYSQLESYQDKAVLYLSYRLEGRPIQEPHPLAIAWNRKHQFSADWFNSQIRCDGKQLSCYVFDISSGNIDNQQVWIPVDGNVPILGLRQDRIASHFLFGNSELPLNESPAADTSPLLHPILGFMQTDLQSRWLHEPSSIKRLPNAKLDGQDCYRVQSNDRGREYVSWINTQSGVIKQVELPLQYLHSDVLAAQEITQLKFCIRFHEVEMNQMIPPKRLLTEKKLAAKTVRRFVELPDSLPSQMLGKQIEKLDFVQINGKSVELRPGGNTTVLLWLNAVDASQRLEELARLKSQIDKSISMFAVISDDFLLDPLRGPPELLPTFKKLRQSAIPLLHDRKLKNSLALKIKAVPCIAVFNKQLELQYADAIESAHWTESAITAVTRIGNGEPLAAEMIAQYQKHLDSYHRQLALAGNSAANSANSSSKSIVSQSVAVDNKLAWQLNSLKEPGNVYSLSDSDLVYVIDGWQTVVQLDIENDEPPRTFPLELPNGAAINRLRLTRNRDQKIRIAAYSLLGKQVFIFDDEFRLISQFPESLEAFQHDGITQCQWLDQGEKILCSFIDDHGLIEFNLQTNTHRSLLDQPTKTFCQLDGGLIHVDEDRFVFNRSPIPGLENLKAVSSLQIPDHESGCLLVGVDPGGSWHLNRVDKNGKVAWNSPIGDQYFEHDMESVSIGQSGSLMTIAVTSTDGVVQILNGTGQQVRTHHLSRQIRGLGISQFGKMSRMIISQDEVQCWVFPTHLTSSNSSTHHSQR